MINFIKKQQKYFSVDTQTSIRVILLLICTVKYFDKHSYVFWHAKSALVGRLRNIMERFPRRVVDHTEDSSTSRQRACLKINTEIVIPQGNKFMATTAKSLREKYSFPDLFTKYEIDCLRSCRGRLHRSTCPTSWLPPTQRGPWSVRGTRQCQGI